MTPDLEHLKQVACAALSADWTWNPTGLIRDEMASLSVLHSHNHTPYVSHPVARHIVAAQPSVVLALISELEAGRAEIEKLKNAPRKPPEC